MDEDAKHQTYSISLLHFSTHKAPPKLKRVGINICIPIISLLSLFMVCNGFSYPYC